MTDTILRFPPPKQLQSNFNSSNTDGSFTMAYSNSILSQYEILPIAKKKKKKKKKKMIYLLFYHEIVCLYVIIGIAPPLMSTLNITFLYIRSKRLP